MLVYYGVTDLAASTLGAMYINNLAGYEHHIYNDQQGRIKKNT